MPTPNKPAVVIRAEGRSHRTKAELELREKGEAALATGEPMKARKEVWSFECALCPYHCL